MHDIDNKCDAGEDVSGDLDGSKAERPNLAPRRVYVDFPAWVVDDRIATPAASA